jgi:RNA polymerase sigma-70 factor (ECF subfamily)
LAGDAVEEPDPQVVLEAQRGKAAAFEVLVRAYQAPVWRLVHQLVRDRQLAEDVTQEAFLRAYRFLPRYRGDSRFSTWLLSVARNCAMDELRRYERRQRLAERLRARPQTPLFEPGLPLEVQEIVASLPPELREPIVLIDMLGVSYAEVSTILKTPVGTIKSRVHRGRSMLAAALQPAAEDASEERP